MRCTYCPLDGLLYKNPFLWKKRRRKMNLTPEQIEKIFEEELDRLWDEDKSDYIKTCINYELYKLLRNITVGGLL